MENPSIMNHVSVGVSDLDRATGFYDEVLATIGASRQHEAPNAVAYGKLFPEFWVQLPHGGGSPAAANGVHFAFFANSKDEVQAFYDTAVRLGGRDGGTPGQRPEYGEPYYGCFVYDLDGHKIEATYWDAPPPA